MVQMYDKLRLGERNPREYLGVKLHQERNSLFLIFRAVVLNVQYDQL